MIDRKLRRPRASRSKIATKIARGSRGHTRGKGNQAIGSELRQVSSKLRENPLQKLRKFSGELASDDQVENCGRERVRAIILPRKIGMKLREIWMARQGKDPTK